MTLSPPTEAHEFRAKSVSPVSPKPLHFPAPSNIPILEKSMDPAYDDTVSFAQISEVTGGANGHTTTAQEPDPDVNMTTPSQPTPEVTNKLEAGSIVAFNGNAAAPATAAPSAAEDTLPENSASSGGGVDYKALLANLSTPSPPPTFDNQSSQLPKSVINNTAAVSAPLAPIVTTSLPPAPELNSSGVISPVPSAGLPSSMAKLPPRPPPQERPATHPNYAPGDDIRAYHPHSQGNPSASYRAQAGMPPLSTAIGANGLPPPPAASFQQPPPGSATSEVKSPDTPGAQLKDSTLHEDEDVPWGPDVQKIYDEFLRQERIYVTEGQWDRFPVNSRLFVGNLPTEKVTKRDMFHIFYRYGKLAQISIKQAYGFIQFLDAESCHRALQGSQRGNLRGRSMHLEISKPQKNTKPAEGGRNGGGKGRRSRSPGPDHGRNRGPDRYTGNATSPRDREFRRSRDDYRPNHSPSPRGGHRRGGRNRSPDRYDGRRRSRSRSPYGRVRYRGSSPRPEVDDDLPLPRRSPDQVPDVQILVVDDVNRTFIQFVENGFRARQLRCDVLILGPRLSEAAVIRRQIIEGVQAVSRINRLSVQTGLIPLQVFDRRGGAQNVQFNEYADLETNVAAELVVRAKADHRAAQLVQPVQTALPALPVGYGLPAQYGVAPQQIQPQPQPQLQAAPDYSSLIASLDANGLQQLLASLQSSTPQQTPFHQQQAPVPQQQASPSATGLSPELASLLATMNQQPTQQQPQPQHQQQATYAALANNPSLAALFGNGTVPVAQPQPQPQHAQSQHHQQPQHQAHSRPQHQASQSQGQPDMQQIMAQLSMYRR